MPTPPCAADCLLVSDLLAQIATLTGRTPEAVRWATLGGTVPAFTHTCSECTAEYTSPLAAAMCAEQDRDRQGPRR